MGIMSDKYQTEIKILIVDRPPATRNNVWATMKNKIQWRGNRADKLLFGFRLLSCENGE